MDLDTYTPQALSTAEPRAHDLQYLLPGIIGETGEFFAEFAKQHWHGTDRADTIVDEYGDIAWLTAVLLNRYDIGQAEVRAMTRTTVYTTRESALDLLLSRAAAVYRSAEAQRPQRAAGLWQVLEDSAEVLTGKPLSAALEVNLAKLAQRHGAGELHNHA